MSANVVVVLALGVRVTAGVQRDLVVTHDVVARARAHGKGRYRRQFGREVIQGARMHLSPF